jgi:hypothetical protein
MVTETKSGFTNIRNKFDTCSPMYYHPIALSWWKVLRALVTRTAMLAAAYAPVSSISARQIKG